jgi:transposase
MRSLPVGVDIAKDTFTAAYWLDDAGHTLGTFPNTVDGFTALCDTVHPLLAQDQQTAVHLVLEATAGYELALALWAHQRGWQVSMPNPNQVRDWAKGLGQRAKTDTLDARLLAHYAADCKWVPWHPLPDAVQGLDHLLHRKDDLELTLRQERNRQANLQQRPGVPPAVQTNLDTVIAALDAALAQIEQAIQDVLEQHPDLADQTRRLRSVPGIGERNVLYLLVLLHRWNSLTSGQGTAKGLTAYAGLDPQTCTSGTSVQHRAMISRMGNRQIRQRLFMSALGGTHGKTVLREFYQRLVGRGKPKMVALVAASRKILIWAWEVFRHGTTFDPAKAGKAGTVHA